MWMWLAARDVLVTQTEAACHTFLRFPSETQAVEGGVQSRPSEVLGLGHPSTVDPVILSPCQTFEILVALYYGCLICHECWHHLRV